MEKRLQFLKVDLLSVVISLSSQHISQGSALIQACEAAGATIPRYVLLFSTVEKTAEGFCVKILLP